VQPVEPRHQRIVQRRRDRERAQRTVEVIRILALSQCARFDASLSHFLYKQTSGVEISTRVVTRQRQSKLSESSESLRNLGDDGAAVLMFSIGPVEQAGCANLTASCSGYFDRTNLALKLSRSWGHQLLVGFSEHRGSVQLS
jgi:hypothetical protein